MNKLLLIFLSLIVSITCYSQIRLDSIQHKKLLSKDSNNNHKVSKYWKYGAYHLSENNIINDEKSDPKALQIIRKTVRLFKENSASDLPQYSYKAYDKFSLDVHPDSIFQYRSSLLKDSVLLKTTSKKVSLKRLTADQKLLVWERLQEINFKKGVGEKIIITDNKLSGTEVPIMEMFVIQNNRNKLPDILEEKERKLHQFHLLDSIQIEKRKTYVIYYHYINQEKKSTKDYYNGYFYIDAETYGIKRFEYKADEKGTSFYIADWKYVFEKWFLEEENLMMKVYRFKLNHKKERFGIYSFMNSKYYEFKENAMDNFEGYTYEVKNTNGKIINSERYFPLQERENRSCKALDSLRTKYKLDRKVHFINGLISGMIRLGKVDFDPLELVNYNDFESLRLGMLVKTNSLLDLRISPDLQISYGTRDTNWKYKFGIDFRRRLDKNAMFRVTYFNTIMTSGDFSRKFWNFKMRTMNFGNNFNNDKYFSLKGISFSYLEDLTNSLTLAMEVKRSKETALFDYGFSEKGNSFTNLSSHFTLKYSPNTTNVMTYDGKSIVDQGYPEVYINWEQGYKNFGGKLSYGRFDFLFIHQSKSILGNTGIKFFGGLVTGKAPIWHLFTINGLASSEKRLNFNVTSFLGFATLIGGEYYADRFAGVYISHELPWYFRILGKNTSSIDIVYRGNIGNLNNKEQHQFPIKTLDRLYQEVGLEYNNFLSTPFNLGLFYRIGYYNTPSFMNNFGLQLKLNFLKF